MCSSGFKKTTATLCDLEVSYKTELIGKLWSYNLTLEWEYGIIVSLEGSKLPLEERKQMYCQNYIVFLSSQYKDEQSAVLAVRERFSIQEDNTTVLYYSKSK